MVVTQQGYGIEFENFLARNLTIAVIIKIGLIAGGAWVYRRFVIVTIDGAEIFVGKACG